MTLCCSFEGQRCVHLKITNTKVQAGICRIYPFRTQDCPECGGENGQHQTVTGMQFRCVHMSVKLKEEGAPHPKCGYAAIKSLEGVPVKGA